MNKPVTTTVTALVLLTLFGCQSAKVAPPASQEYNREVANLKLSQDEAGIFLFVQETGWRKLCEGLNAVRASVNGEEVSQLMIGDVAFVRAAPGTHYVSFSDVDQYGNVGDLDLTDSKEIELKGGETSYIVGHCKTGGLSPHGVHLDIDVLSNAAGERLLSESDLHLSRQKKITTTGD